MKNMQRIGISVLIVSACLCAFAQTTNSYVATNTNVLFAYLTNTSRLAEITNVVFEAGQLYVQLDTASEFKIPVSEEGRTNIVNWLLASGEFCRTKGHAWTNHAHVTLEYIEGKLDCRKCQACGAHQTLFADWK